MLGENAILIYGNEHNKLSIEFNPFIVHVYKNGAPLVVLNGDSLFNFQTHNEAQIAKAAANETGLNWSETFKSHTDSRKHGPSSIGMDITFLNFEHVYGIPEHAEAFDLPDTVSRDPYRLYNLDVFAYELHETMALYGSVPVLHAHAINNSMGIFWNNPTETWIDIQSSRSASKGLLSSFFSSSDNGKWTRTHWMSETGIVDLFIMLGPTPQDVSKQYATITGTTPLPPLFSLAYHQCRWNYNDQADITGLDSNFDKYKIPADVLWLDIEHTDGKRYFTWDQGKFPNPGEMVDKLLEKKRRLVTVVDPHIKSDPGEPSVFSGPEVTMHKDAVHLNGFEHRDVHNLYGMYVHQATWEGQLLRSQNQKRPFVLTRAFYAGSQRTSAVWTGDNAAEWSHLKISIPMLLSLSITGITFCGADVGGFFNNPEVNLLTRWYQAGAYQPFFRAHAHLDTPRREPWLYPEETVNRIRSAVEQRYALLPYWYMLFAVGEVTGQPPMAPLWYHFPSQADLFSVETAYMVGPAMLVSPVLEKDAASVEVLLPAGATWYQMPNFKIFNGGQKVSIPVSIDDIPVFYRGGHIVPRRERMRRTSSLMANDPYTLFVMVDPQTEKAEGYIYEDDNESVHDPNRLLLKVVFEQQGLSAKLKLQLPDSELYRGLKMKHGVRENKIERIVVVGMKLEVKTCEVMTVDSRAIPVRCKYVAQQAGLPSVLEIKKPEVMLSTDWTLLMSPTRADL
ncbi:hypothetical protein Ciccas_008552 [Cichlidogyrus casuarinus]|uniref:Glucosidase II subunit alpha n=1 Tax=Cichlidogyrus casuarinus TaxID=1844966 RepID=A0ABD2Q292_9PLAT